MTVNVPLICHRFGIAINDPFIRDLLFEIETEHKKIVQHYRTIVNLKKEIKDLKAQAQTVILKQDDWNNQARYVAGKIYNDFIIQHPECHNIMVFLSNKIIENHENAIKQTYKSKLIQDINKERQTLFNDYRRKQQYAYAVLHHNTARREQVALNSAVK